MSKNKKTEANETVEQKVITDPFEYGYQNGTLVAVPAQVFAKAMQFLAAFAQGEITERIEFNRFDKEAGPVVDERGQLVPQKEVVVLSISNKGKKAEIIFNELMDVHIDNINKDIAIYHPAFEAPKLDFSNE